MNGRNHYFCIALIKPFQEPSQIEAYKRKLDFDNAAVNTSGKIWLFYREEWEVVVLLDTIQ